MTAARPTVLVAIKGLGIGGAEMLIARGAHCWDRNRFDYHVAYALSWKDQLVDDLRAQDVPVHFVGTRRGLTPRAAVRLRRLAQEIGADLVHAHLPSMGVACGWVSPVPVVYTEHNVVDSYRWVTRAANRRSYGRHRAVIAVSEAVAQSVAGFPGPPRLTIPNGVFVQVTADEASAARAELQLGPNDRLAVHIGNVRPYKGHANLVAATAQLVRTHPDVTVISIGVEKNPGDLAPLREQAAAAGLGDRIRFLGRRSDAMAFAAAADVFVNPSDVEGLPIAVLEAMALGKPIAATAVGGVPTIIKDGETGLLVEPGNPVALARAMAALFDDPTRGAGMGKSARSLVERDYGLAQMVAKVEKVYESVLGG